MQLYLNQTPNLDSSITEDTRFSFFLTELGFPLIAGSFLNNPLPLLSKCHSCDENVWSVTSIWPEDSRKRSYLQEVISKLRCERCVRMSQVKGKEQAQRICFQID